MSSLFRILVGLSVLILLFFLNWHKGELFYPLVQPSAFDREKWQDAFCSFPPDVFHQLSLLKGIERDGVFIGRNIADVEDLLSVKYGLKKRAGKLVDGSNNSRRTYCFDTFALELEVRDKVVVSQKVLTIVGATW